ncbi:MAG: hypothetical protein ACK4VI_05830 [Alphaproteobacteria bacterium]
MLEPYKKPLRPHYIRRNLMGCLEIALFMRSGVERFSMSYSGMKLSFIIPFLILPLSIATMIFAHPNQELSAGSIHAIALIYGLRTVLYLAAFTGIMYIMARKLNRMEGFTRFVTANNWLVLPAAILMLPLSLAFMGGYYSWEQVYPMMVCFTLYAYAYTAFMATHALRLPVELGVFVSICSMAVHQTALDVVRWAGTQGFMLLA